MNTTALLTLISCGTALAGNIDVTSDVISSETWTAADEYGFIDGVSSECGSCSGDANADGVVGFQDLTTVLGNWGCTGN